MKKKLLCIALLVTMAVSALTGCSSPMAKINNFATTGNTELSSFEVLPEVSKTKTYAFFKKCQELKQGTIEFKISGLDDTLRIVTDGDKRYTEYFDDNGKSSIAVLKIGDKIYYIRTAEQEYVEGDTDDPTINDGIIDGVIADFSKFKLVSSSDDKDVFTVREEMSSTDHDYESVTFVVKDKSCHVIMSEDDSQSMDYVIRDLTDDDKKLLSLDTYKLYVAEESSGESSAESSVSSDASKAEESKTSSVSESSSEKKSKEGT